jgi:hypothetical protein
VSWVCGDRGTSGTSGLTLASGATSVSGNLTAKYRPANCRAP